MPTIYAVRLLHQVREIGTVITTAALTTGRGRTTIPLTKERRSKMHLEFFPPVALALAQEVKKHPKLLERLSLLGDAAPLEEQVAVIAAYCDMVLDGYYVEKELEIIFNDMVEKLRKKGTVHISLH